MLRHLHVAACSAALSAMVAAAWISARRDGTSTALPVLILWLALPLLAVGVVFTAIGTSPGRRQATYVVLAASGVLLVATLAAMWRATLVTQNAVTVAGNRALPAVGRAVTILFAVQLALILAVFVGRARRQRQVEGMEGRVHPATRSQGTHVVRTVHARAARRRDVRRRRHPARSRHLGGAACARRDRRRRARSDRRPRCAHLGRARDGRGRRVVGAAAALGRDPDRLEHPAAPAAPHPGPAADGLHGCDPRRPGTRTPTPATRPRHPTHDRHRRADRSRRNRRRSGHGSRLRRGGRRDRVRRVRRVHQGRLGSGAGRLGFPLAGLDRVGRLLAHPRVRDRDAGDDAARVPQPR